MSRTGRRGTTLMQTKQKKVTQVLFKGPKALQLPLMVHSIYPSETVYDTDSSYAN